MLTKRQQLFVDQYCLTKNGSFSAKAAGYGAASAKVTASRLLTYPAVKAAIAEREADMQLEFNVTKAKVIQELQEAIALAKLAGEAGTVINGWKIIGQLCGFFAPETHTVTINTDAGEMLQDLERLSDAELMSIVCTSH